MKVASTLDWRCAECGAAVVVFYGTAEPSCSSVRTHGVTRIVPARDHTYAIDVLEQKATQLDGFARVARGKRRAELEAYAGLVRLAIASLGGRL